MPPVLPAGGDAGVVLMDDDEMLGARPKAEALAWIQRQTRLPAAPEVPAAPEAPAPSEAAAAPRTQQLGRCVAPSPDPGGGP